MGIYDNWKQSYSTAVPTFVPNRSKLITDYIDRENKNYEATQDYLNVIDTGLREAPISQADKGQYDRINTEIGGKLKELSSRKDLENVTSDAYKLASYTKGKLAGLVSRHAEEQSYMKSLNEMVEKGKLDEGTKQKVLAYVQDQSTETQFDESGRVIGGFNPIAVAANVDRIDKIQKYLSKIPGQKYNVVRNGDTGAVKYVNEQGIEVKLPNDIALQLKASLDLDPEINAMDNRDAMLAAHEATRGLSDEAVLNSLKYSPRTGEDLMWQKSIKDLISSGVPPTQAVKQVEQARHLRAIHQTELQVALGESYQNITDKQESEAGWLTKADDAQRRTQENDAAKAKAEKEDVSDWEITSATANVWGENGEQVLKGVKGVQSDIKALDEEIAYNTKLKASNKLSGNNTVDVDAKLDALEGQKAYLLKKENQVKNAWKNFLDQGSLKANGMSIESVMKTIEDGIKKDLAEKQPNLTAEQQDKVAKAFTARLESGDFDPVPLQNKENSTPVAFSEAFNGTPKPGVLAGATVGGVNLNRATVDYLNKRIGNTDKIKKAYKEARSLASKDVSITTTGMKFKDAEKLKAGLRSGLNVLDVDMKTPVDMSSVDISKVQEGFYNKDLDKVAIQYTDADGNLKNGWVDMSNTTYKKSEGERLVSQNNISSKERGIELLMDDTKNYIEAFTKGAGIIKEHPFAKDKQGKPLTMTYKGEQLGTKETPDGYVFVTLDAAGNPKKVVEVNGKKRHSFESVTKTWRNLQIKANQE